MLNKGIRNIGISGELPYRIDNRPKGGDERGKEAKYVILLMIERYLNLY